jgi:hypothetical protein
MNIPGERRSTGHDSGLPSPFKEGSLGDKVSKVVDIESQLSGAGLAYMVWRSLRRPLVWLRRRLRHNATRSGPDAASPEPTSDADG